MCIRDSLHTVETQEPITEFDERLWSSLVDFVTVYSEKGIRVTFKAVSYTHLDVYKRQAWTYEPYERFDVEMPDGSFKSYGRISRSNCTWDCLLYTSSRAFLILSSSLWSS